MLNKIIFNTGVLYFKLLISIFAAFLTSRLVLNALGEVDYGINSLVAGVIGMLAFLQSTIATASIRFLSISLGQKDLESVKNTFNSSLLIHLMFGLIIWIIIETGGIIMFKYVLSFPSNRLSDAWFVYHLMALTTFISIISVPYDAIIEAHEDFLAFSIIDTIGILIGVGIAISITFLPKNTLVMYGLFTLFNQLTIRIIKQIYCNRKYSVCKVQLKTRADKSLIMNILSFAGWKTLDAGASLLYVQLKSVIINVFFGVVLNAANGIATNLTMQINNFSSNLTTAINPQLIKSEGAGNRNRLIELTKVSAKFSLFVFAIFSLPILFETEYLLKWWLKKAPEYTTIFIRLILIEMLIQKATHPLITAIQAVGKIKGITLIVSINLILQLLSTYYFYKIGFAPPVIYTIAIVGSVLISTTSRLYYAQVLVNIKTIDYLKSVFYLGLMPVILTSIIALLPILFLKESFYRMIFTGILTSTSMLFFIRYLGLTSSELLKITELLSSAKNKFYKRNQI